MNLEQAIEFVRDDEYVEATPQSIRMRKKILAAEQTVEFGVSWSSGQRVSGKWVICI